ncbi:hypothetical protein [Streptomonospora arabica]|uniref:Translation initiation factor IF-2 n=1 Tax=Streptomonospora arabica TaxID=412417 RepID=A0ABV9SRP5_9ACTN
MTEPFAARPGAAGRRAPGPSGLLHWPSRIPLNQRADARPGPLRETGDSLDGQPGLPDVVPQAHTPRSDAADAAAPARRGISVPDTRQEPVAKPATAPEGRPLGRPGPPALAGAAIAGLLLVVAPLAMSALQRPETLATVPVTAGVGLRAEGPESGGGGAGAGQQESDTTAGTESLSGGAPADSPPDRGYVPEAVPQEESGTSATGEQAQSRSQGEGTDSGHTDAAGAGGGVEADGAPQSTPEADSGDQDGEGGGGDGGGGEPGPDSGDAPAGSENESRGDDGDDGENDAPGPGDEPAGDSGDAQAAPMMAGPSAGGEPSPEGEEAAPSPSASSSGPEFTALAGPGCPGGAGASYGAAGRGGDAPRWATRDGGYALDGCDGTYDAIPVSGTAEYGDGRYAYWSFTPGFADAQCDVYVYIPEDASPQWVTDREAMYQIFPGPEPSGSAAAVFGVRQAESKGGWVKVTGFVSPTERFTVQLTNIGEDAVAGQGGATSHVAASAVRASCT